MLAESNANANAGADDDFKKVINEDDDSNPTHVFDDDNFSRVKPVDDVKTNLDKGE